MDDDSSSMISSRKTNTNNFRASMETSDPNNANYAIQIRNKRSRHEHHHVDHTPSLPAKFKGVVPQQNGHWGAQIYVNHRRIWLGTFKSEKAAAMAYDSAAIKLRSSNSQRNFPWTSLTIQEPDFQSRHGVETVLNMIKDGSYQLKFEEFIRSRSRSRTQRKATIENTSLQDHHQQNLNRIKGGLGDAPVLTRQLFQKELTPSDVGKLNRLVIPKKYAVKYFPFITEEINHVEGNGVEDIELVFYDKKMRPWRFRYCYWRSSQSFVFTRGWNRFVKANNLKANDVITFYARDRSHGGQSFSLIEVTHNGVNNNEGINNDYYHCDKMLKMEWKQNFGQGTECKYNKNVEVKGFRLFGVDIK